jgi:hypothetical protein
LARILAIVNLSSKAKRRVSLKYHSRPFSEGWKGVEGHVGGDIIKENAFAPEGAKESAVSLCGGR